MKPKLGFDDFILEQMAEKGISKELTFKILKQSLSGKSGTGKPVEVTGFPTVDNKTIIGMTNDCSWSVPLQRAQANIEGISTQLKVESFGTIKRQTLYFTREQLIELGIALYPYVAYGILNGGSATSYVDRIKNKEFNPAIFSSCRKEFDRIASIAMGKAKGLTPAYINIDGTPGPSFIELKMRALLIQAYVYQLKYGIRKDRTPEPLYPLFQMTSVSNNEEILEAFEAYRTSPVLKDLIRETGINITRVETGVQPMLAAFTHSSAGKKKAVFTGAYGNTNEILALPGGHGQNFAVLSEVYLNLHKKRKRFVYLGNVDNLGYTVDPASVAILALSGKQAAFDFSYKTSVDIKGGILVYDQRNRLTCADIGPALSGEEVENAEKRGKTILFNCATGLFNLSFLVEKIDYISEKLPMRFSDQDKEAGQYSQAEQVTWEIIGLLTNFLIFAVDKYDRFLASKLLIENLMTSGVGLENHSYTENSRLEKNLRSVGRQLCKGLYRKLATVYGMKLLHKRWLPKSIPELRRELTHEKGLK
ncbi:MAG: UTP--glucose-1-phosphate uridylyltransferase [Spirochaetota bacterium]